MVEPAHSDRLDKAVALAIEAFRHKRRKGSDIPYVTHLFMVTALVGEHGGDEDQLIAAMLHDYLEDIEGSSARHLEDVFGERVARMVVALSDTTARPKPPWKQRKLDYIAHLHDQPAEVKLICAADKLHNSRSLVRDHHRLGDAIFERFNPSKSETLWYYRECYGALSNGWGHRILGDLEISVTDLHAVAGARWP